MGGVVWVNLIGVAPECPSCGFLMHRKDEYVTCGNQICEKRGVQYERPKVQLIPYTGAKENNERI